MHEEFKDDIRAIRDDIAEIKVETIKNTLSLDHHIARTEIAERRLERLEYVLIGIAAVGVLGGVIKLLIS